MSENPLMTLARVLGGVVLMEGNLGHQVLGQLLIMNTNEVAMAGAIAVVAGARGRRGEVGQIALRTIAPALAARAIINKSEQRLERKTLRLQERERDLEKQRRVLKVRRRRLHRRLARLPAP